MAQVKEAVINTVKETTEPMKQVATQTKAMAQSSANNIKQVSNQMQVLANTTKQTTAQQQVLIDKINDMKADLSTMSAKELNSSVGKNLQAEIEKSENKLKSLQKTTENVGSSTNNSFNKGLKAVRRFVFGLVSAGSAFALISRGIQSYLQTNEEAQKKYELTSNTIGSLLAPAMEMLLNIIQYLIIGMALLIQMFTGFNVLAKITTKNISNAKKETKALNKELLAMDEITNLSQNDNATGIDLTSDYNALSDFQKKVVEVQALFEKWDIQSIVNKLKDMATWLWDNRDAVIAVGIVLGSMFAAAKIAGWVSSIATLIGVAGTGATAGVGATGLAGMAGMLKYLGTIGLITIAIVLWSKAIPYLQELNKEILNNGGYWENWKKGMKLIIDDIGRWFKGLGNTIYDNTIGKIKQFNELVSNSGGAWENWKGGMKIILHQLKVPGFATGTVATQPTFGQFGEYAGASSNPEIVSPQSIMRQTMKEAFAEILPNIQTNNGGGNTILNINGKEFARAIKSDLDYENNRVGSSTILRRS